MRILTLGIPTQNYAVWILILGIPTVNHLRCVDSLTETKCLLKVVCGVLDLVTI